MPLVVFAFDPADTDLVSGAGAAQLPPQHAAEALGEKSCGSPVGTAWSPGISVAAIGLRISPRISRIAPMKHVLRRRNKQGRRPSGTAPPARRIQFCLPAACVQLNPPSADAFALSTVSKPPTNLQASYS